MNQVVQHRPKPLRLATTPKGGALVPKGPESELAIDDGASSSIRFGLLVLLVFLGLTGYWLYSAPLDSAVIAPGVIKVEGNRKAVQHLDGGIVRELLVKEGDLVQRGQVMLRLDPVQPRAAVDILLGQLDSLRAQEARLKTERDGDLVIQFPPELMARAGVPAAADAMRAEQQLFAARRASLEAQLSVQRQTVLQLNEQTRGLQEQVVALERQRALIKEELDGTRDLYEQGYATKTRLLALERAAAALGGQVAEYRGTLGRARYGISQAEAQMEQAKRDRLQQVSTDLSGVQSRLNDTSERLNAARDVLDRVEIKAPETGYVVGLTAFTVGGVINRGDRIMEIVPEGSQMVIEARLRPEDAKDVHDGMRTEVHLSAYKSRGMPIIHGKVIGRSADRFTDPRTGEGFYTAQVEIDEMELKSLPDVKLAPGMPAEVIVPTGSRTALQYLVEPITSTFRKSFKEKY